MVFIVLSAVLAFGGVMSIWINRQMLHTDNWVGTSAELLDDEEIRAQVSTFLVEELYANTDVQARLAEALPDETKPLAGPVAGGLRNLAESATDELLQRPRVQAAWEEANRRAHERFLFVLGGGGDVLSTAEGTVTLDLRALLGETAGRVGVGERVQARIPPDAGQIEIMRSDDLEAAQTGLRVLRRLPIVLVGLSLLCAAFALWRAVGWRREAVRAWGAGFVAAGVAALLVKSVGGDAVVDGLATSDAVQPAATAAWGISTDLLDQVAVAAILYGLIAIFGAWLAGPTVWAVSTRAAVAPFLREPRFAWGGFAAFLVLMVWWEPTPATRNPVTGMLLAAILALGLEALRRQTAREHPDASLEEASARRRAEFARAAEGGRSMAAGVHRPTAAGAGSEPPRGAPPTSAPARAALAAAAEQQRLDRLERLGRMRADGVLEEDEFRREKERVLATAGADGPGAPGAT